MKTKLFTATYRGLIVFLSLCFLSGNAIASENEKETAKAFECPYSHISDQDKCLTCHGQGYLFKKITEARIESLYNPPVYTRILVDSAGNEIGYFDLGDVTHNCTGKYLREGLNYLFVDHQLDKCIIDIHSPGGSLFEAWKIVGIIQGWQAKGKIIQTQCHAFAMSAGFLIFATGKPRLVSPMANLMWHELLTFSMFSISTPSSSEDEAKILRKLQNAANRHLANVSKMAKQEIDDATHKKELWMTGIEAVNQYGFADELIGGNTP